MSRMLWLPIVFLACALLAQAEVSVEDADCPNDCTCEMRAMAVILSCKRFITEKDRVAHMPISKFELSNVAEPITLGENVFLNMGLTHVNVISIANVSIESLDKNAFAGLEELSNIKIAHSKLSNLHPDTFKNIEDLEKLNLVGNPLNQDTIIVSETLEELRMSHCGLKDISKKMFEQTPLLTLLDLTGNGIEELPSDVFDPLEDITEIILSHNKLRQLPKEMFSKNKNLELLDVSNNPLSSFSSEHVSNLQLLNLGSCLLTEIDANMFKNMTVLYNLDLSYNKISNIDPLAFRNIPQIGTIDLSNNELEILDENLFVSNIDLQKLNLDNNLKLQGLPVNGFKAPKPYFSIQHFSCNYCNLKSLSRNTFKNMPNLHTLLLSHNQIEDISMGVFQDLITLEDLNLSYNQITTIDENTFIKNKNLNKLNLSFNTLKSFHPNIFRESTNIKNLNISHCGLFQLWSGPTTNIKIPSMVTINASYNKIKVITKENLAVTNHLSALDISNNNIQCNEDLKNLVIYLETAGIKNSEFVTHEQQSYDFESRKEENDKTSWSMYVKKICPLLLDEEEQEEFYDDDFEEDIESDTKDYTGEEEEVTFGITADEIPKEDMILSYHHEERYWPYFWAVMVFLGTALAVLGLVANIILFVIRRRQSKPIPRIISTSRMPRLKTNSGLVYQQLSEELGGPKTPIFSRFAPIPTVHGIINESEHV